MSRSPNSGDDFLTLGLSALSLNNTSSATNEDDNDLDDRGDTVVAVPESNSNSNVRGVVPSRSRAGLRTTRGLADHSTGRTLERSNLGMSKRGNKEDGTDAAHIMSFAVTNVILVLDIDNEPLSESEKRELIRQLNADSNLRIKSQRGNRVLDDRRDARIGTALKQGHAISGHSTVLRARQALISTRAMSHDAARMTLAPALASLAMVDPDTKQFTTVGAWLDSWEASRLRSPKTRSQHKKAEEANAAAAAAAAATAAATAAAALALGKGLGRLDA